MKGTRILGAVVAAMAAIALAEISIGVVAPSFDPRQQIKFERIDGTVPVGIPNTVTRQVKNTGDYNVAVHINKYGFRDAKDIATAGPSDYLLVGDSYAFGWGVAEGKRLSDLLQGLLHTRVFNIAITGNFDTYQDLLDYAAHNGARSRNVILCVTMESDLQVYDTAPIPEPTAAALNDEGLPTIKTWFMMHSGLYFAATTLVHRLPWLETLAVELGLVTPNLEGVESETFDPKVVESSALRVARLAKKYRTIVVIIPSRALWVGPHQADQRRTHEVFVARLRALGLDVVDLRAAFEKGGKPLQYHFRNDPHWNAAGHALAARIVATHIAAER